MRQWSSFLFSSGVILLVLCFSRASFADGVVKSDFVFQLDNSIFDDPKFDFLSRLQGHEDVNMNDTVIQGEVPATIHGIRAGMDYKFNTSSNQIVLGAEQALVSDSLNVNLTIDQISVDTVVRRMVGGVLIEVHVQGACANIPLNLSSAKARVVGALKVALDANGLPTLSAPWFEAQWTPDAWTVGDFSCVGPDGFKEQIQAGLQNYLGDPSSFNADFKALIDSRLAQYQTEIRGIFLQPREYPIGGGGMKAVLFPRAIANLKGDRFQLVGSVQFIFKSTTVSEITEVSGTAPPPAALDGYALLMPQAFVSAMNAMAYKTGNYIYRKSGQQIQAFHDLLSSGFKEFFVWPELRNYSSNADFYFKLIASQAPRVSKFTDMKDGTLLQAVVGSMSVETWAPTTKGGHERMVTFMTPVNGSYRLALAKGAAGPELRATFMTTGLKLNGEWDGDYATHLRNSYIALDRIQIAISTSLKTDGLALPVGQLPLTSRILLTPSGLGLEGDWLRLNWSK
jgi:hypothetical protein